MLLKTRKQLATLLILPATVFAGPLDSPAPPTDPGSAMYSLDDICNRLTTGAAPTPFNLPPSGSIIKAIPNLRPENIKQGVTILGVTGTYTAPATPPPAPATPSTGTFRDTLKDGSLGPEMVVIPGGTFKMGDIQGGGYDDEEPVHDVTVASFAMGKYEVTFAEYDRFVEATKYDRFAKATSRSKPDDEGWGRGNRPVINVSWLDVTAYAEWLTEQTGYEYEYRLPTEAEWEYTARAGTQTKYWWGNEAARAARAGTQIKYWWGNKASHEYANYGADSCCSGLAEGKDQWVNTSPIGSFAPNPFGLHDTAGNVWEWTCSQYDDSYKGHEYQCLSKEDAYEDSLFVLRGGSWVNGAGMIRSAYRDKNQRSFRSRGVGVRLVINL